MITVDYRMCRSSGIGVYLRHIVSHLVARAPAFEVALLGGDNVPGAVFHRAMGAGNYSLAEQVEIPIKAPRRTKIFWSPNYNSPFVSPGELIVTVHDLCHVALAELLDTSIKRRYARLMFDNVRRRAAHVMCVSEFTRSELIRLTGIEPGRITVVPSGLPADWTTRPIERRAIDDPYLLFVGNVKPHKNLVRLLGAFERLSPRIPHRLVIVGRRDGFITPDRNVSREAERLGARVVFTGEVSEDAIRSLYAHADLLVFPSLYEGFGLPPLEAMALGVPVAASHAGSIPEICGDAAAYFDPYSIDEMAAVIERALADAALRTRLTSLGAARARRYPLVNAGLGAARVFERMLRQ